MKRGASLVVNGYPLEIFPNWNVLSKEKYYVAAPIDKLGEWTYHLRTHITALILAGNPATIFLQLVWLGRIFLLLNSLNGFSHNKETNNDQQIWLFDARLGRLLAILLSIGFFICGVLKVSLALPRPPAPPAVRLSEEDRDWAWPSNHALLGTLFPWFIWMYSCKHYDLSLTASFILLATVLIWNSGVSWSRIYLGVHSPCDVLSGWVIGVFILFVFSGFSDRFYDVYVESSKSNPAFFIYLYTLALLLLYIHPRAWPETQSYMEVVSILSGTAAIWCGRFFHLDGNELPSLSLLEQNGQASLLQLASRFFIGVAVILVVRVIVKAASKILFKTIYAYLDLPYYSYSEMCKSLGDLQPTKRYTSRMRFKPIPGVKTILPEDAPYDIDLPVKFVVYSAVGFCVGELCPFLFKKLDI